jgi:hypothetical protein
VVVGEGAVQKEVRAPSSPSKSAREYSTTVCIAVENGIESSVATLQANNCCRNVTRSNATRNCFGIDLWSGNCR